MPPPKAMSTPVAPRVTPSEPKFEKVTARIRPRVQRLYRVLQQAELITGLTLNAQFPNRTVLTEVEMGKLLQKGVSEGKSIRGAYVKGWDDVVVFLAGAPASAAYTGELIRRAVRKVNNQTKLSEKAIKRIKTPPRTIPNPNRSIGQLYESFYETLRRR